MLKVFVVYDSKTNLFLNPVFLPTKGHILRALTDLVAKEDHDFCKYSEDFTLYEIGSWDPESGEMSLMSRVSICKLDELKK